MPRGVGCKCGWPLDSCNPDFSDGRCGRKVFEWMPPESHREEDTCTRCHQPIWIVYHGERSNHTVEGRTRKQRDEELRERLEKRLPEILHKETNYIPEWAERVSKTILDSIFEEADGG